MISKNLSTRDAFGDIILQLGKKDKRIIVLSADLRQSLRVDSFARELPKQFIECGVAEQNMIGIASGLASEGLIPYATSFAVFSPGRTWEQIKVSVCLSNLGVKIIGGYGGFQNFKDGATHQALEDIALTRVLPNMKVYAPGDYNQAKQIIIENLYDLSPTYIRLGSESLPNYLNTKSFNINKVQVVSEGTGVVILSYGAMLYHAVQAIKIAKVNATILNVHTLKPLDTKGIKKALKRAKVVLVIEDHQKIGGLGSAIGVLLAKMSYSGKFDIFAVNNKFGKSSRNIQDLYSYFGLGEEVLAKRILKIIEK